MVLKVISPPGNNILLNRFPDCHNELT